MAEQLELLDLRLFHLANHLWTAPWADGFFVWLTAPPHRILIFLALWLGLFLLGGSKGRRTALTLIFVVAVADSLGADLKSFVGRVRPCFALSDARLLIPGQSRSGSFPSNHAVNSFAVATLLSEVHPLLGALGFIVAVLVGYSRIYVGVHYPSDVLGGAVLGTLVALVGIQLRGGVIRLFYRLDQMRRKA